MEAMKVFKNFSKLFSCSNIKFAFFDEGYCNPKEDPNAAGECDPTACQLPDCFCSKDGTQIPG